MSYNREDFDERINEWNKKLAEHVLPKWEELPEFELYMDQVTVLVNKYLAILEDGEERILTPSMINNYVKQRTVLPPVKKRYSRVHLAYLIMICILKQSLSIAMIQKILPVDEIGENVKDIYNAFVEIQNKKFVEVTKEIENKYEEEQFSDKLIMEIAVSANVHNIIAEKLGK